MTQSNKKKVFVVGAGASLPWGYPVAAGLLSGIISDLKNKANVYTVLQKQRFDQKLIDGFEQNLFKADPDTIDQFIANRATDFAKIARAAITFKLAEAEVNPLVGAKEVFMDGSLKRSFDSWLKIFFKHFYGARGQIGRPDIAFVNFNYDRTIEYYAEQHFSGMFGLSGAELEQAINGLNVVHVYGVIGEPHWSGGAVKRAYGDISDFDLLLRCSDLIGTIGHGNNALSDCHRHISSAEVLVCLGFGFSDDNVQKLELKTRLDRNAAVVTTAFNFNDVMRQKVLGVFPGRDKFDMMITHNLSCSQLFHETVIPRFG